MFKEQAESGGRIIETGRPADCQSTTQGRGLRGHGRIFGPGLEGFEFFPGTTQGHPRVQRRLSQVYIIESNLWPQLRHQSTLSQRVRHHKRDL